MSRWCSNQLSYVPSTSKRRIVSDYNLIWQAGGVFQTACMTIRPLFASLLSL